MKHFLNTYFLLLLFSLTTSAETTHPNKQPNILFIMTDDMGWMDLACQVNHKLKTPNIDALAKSAIRFTDAYSASPVCTPTRASLMTGQAPARLHITQHGRDNPVFWPENRNIQPPLTTDILDLEYVTVAERLKNAGYATGFFGKWHLSGVSKNANTETPPSSNFYPNQQGFDVNLGGCGMGGPPTYFDPYRIPTLKPRKEGEYLSDRLADETITWMQANKHQPMFICLWTYNPHYPFEAPEDLIKTYQGKTGPGLINPIYGAQIEATDRALGRVLDELDNLNIKEQTLVIFTSDNGGWSGATDNRPLREGKGFLYEGGIRVPLIIRWPGLTKANEINSTPASSMDLTATILDAAGVTLKQGEIVDGISLKPILQGKQTTRPPLYFHYPHWSFHKENRPGSAIRDGKYKLILRYDDNSTELYNLEADLSETNDLSKKLPKQTAQLKTKLKKWLETTKATTPQPIKTPTTQKL
ncbi:MAG: sulfatase [Akkermansiaceae bacterium]